jgi:chromosome segregation ATPase
MNSKVDDDADRCVHRLRRTLGFALALGVVSSLLIPDAEAQADHQSREREMLRRAQSALQKSEQEKSKLLEEKTALEKEKGDLSVKVKANARTERQLAEARKKEAAQAKGLEGLAQQLESSKAKVAELEAKLKALGGRLAESDAHGQQLSAQAADLGQKLQQQREIIGRQAQTVQACDDKNTKLYQLTGELLSRYERKGVWDSLLQREPFTGIKDVEVQALLQEYKDQADALKIEKPELRQ